jgi:hypothetical protein
MLPYALREKYRFANRTHALVSAAISLVPAVSVFPPTTFKSSLALPYPFRFRLTLGYIDMWRAIFERL